MKISEIINNIKLNIDDICDINSLNKIRKTCDFDIISCNGKEKKQSNIRILIKQILGRYLNEKAAKVIENQDAANINLTKMLKRRLFSPSELNDLLLRYPKINRCIGSLPGNWYDNIENSQKKLISSKVFSVLSNYTILFNGKIQDSKNLVFYTKIFKDKLSALLKQNVEFIFINNGANGNGFKLTVGNHDYFYKAFFPITYMERYPHGRCAEPQTAIYASHNVPKKFVKFYCGKVVSKYDYDAFVLTDFVAQAEISANSQKSKHPELNYLITGDLRDGNVIDETIVDFGDVCEKIPEMQDKTVRKLVNIILKNIEYDYIPAKYTNIWTIRKHNLQILKKYVVKMNNKTVFKKALKVLSINIHNFSPEFLDFLVNIDVQNTDEDYVIYDALNTRELLISNFNKYINTLKFYNISLMTHREPDVEFSAIGYSIHRIDDIKIIQCEYDKFHIIKQIKICYKNENNEYQTILEISPRNINDDICQKFKELLFDNNR